MMMKKILYLAALLLSLGSCSEEEGNKKFVFMDNGRVFEAFEMKKEYDGLMEKEISIDAAQLDSLKRYIQAHASALEKDQLLALQQQYYGMEQQYNARFQELSGKFTNEVNERLNSYIEEYAKSKGYSMILGSGGQGNVMYVDENMNITDDLIKYVNQKYGDE